MEESIPFLSHFSLAGKVAMVTGAGRGIGQACAIALAESGATVIVHTRSTDAKETMDRVTVCSPSAMAVKADLSDRSQLRHLVDEVIGEYGRIDVLVNNAGVNSRYACEEFPEEVWDRIMATNLNAVWLLCQQVGRHMLMQQSGKIINMASMLSFSGGFTIAAYTASKHAVAGITKALANEWASRNINVNALAPGYIETDMSKALKADPVRNRQLLDRIPSGDWGKPADLMGAVVFLASAASNYVHGQVLGVDGGFLSR